MGGGGEAEGDRNREEGRVRVGGGEREIMIWSLNWSERETVCWYVDSNYCLIVMLTVDDILPTSRWLY